MAGLPEGTVIEIPPPSPQEVMGAVFEQLNQIGVFVIILVAMGAIGREVETGLTAFTTTLEFTRRAYFFSKWAVLSLITLCSVLAATSMAGYYTELLFGPLAWTCIIGGALVYGLHGIMVLTITLAIGARFTSQILVAASAIGVSSGDHGAGEWTAAPTTT